jgi:hypothetical protein
MGIRGKILTTFTVMALIPLLLLGFFTAISITDLGDKSVDDSTTALKTQANMDMTTQTEDKATQVEKFFDDIERDTRFLKDFANDLYNNPEKYDTEDKYPNYEYPSNTVSYLPSWGYVHTANDERKGAWADWDGRVQTCPYLNSSVVKRASQDQEFADWLNTEIELTVVFDYIFKPVYQRNQPSVVNVWMVRHGGLTNSYSEPPLDYGELLVEGEITDDWDEDAEEYVTLANTVNNPKKTIVWTDPYFDPVGNGWLVSCIGPIYKGSEFIGTVGIDLQLDTILKSVLGISMYKTGHAFLIDSSGNTIAHKDLDNVRDNQMQSDPDNTDVDIQTLESGSTDFVELLAEMSDTHQGVDEVTYEDGEVNYVGYSEISGTDFYLGIVVPENEVIESVKSTEKSIEDATNETLILIIIIDLIALLVILSVGLAVANRIVTPINQMISVSKRLGVGEIDEALLHSPDVQLDPKKAKKDEIGTLMKSFSNMISSINEKKDKEKKLKAKEQEPIPKQLVQDIKIEIKDSVIHRSTIGSPGTGAATGETRYCLNCGKDLPPGFSGKFCPYCGEEP